MVSLLGVVIMAWGMCLIFEYLDPWIWLVGTYLHNGIISGPSRLRPFFEEPCHKIRCTRITSNEGTDPDAPGPHIFGYLGPEALHI